MHQNKETIRNFIKGQLRELYNETGETTWHAIAKNGDVEIIRKKYFYLDEREINFKNNAGLTPFSIAIEKNDLEMVKELIKYACIIPKEEMLNFIGSAIEKNNLEMVKELIKFGGKIPKEEMLNFIKNSIRNTNSEMSIYLISIFNKNFNSEVDTQGVSPANSSEEEKQSTYDIPSCEPSSAKKMKFALSDYNTRSLS